MVLEIYMATITRTSKLRTAKCHVRTEDVYVGETGRSFSVRLREHKDAVRLGRHPNNAVAKHVHSHLHSIDWEDSKLVYKHESLQQRLIVESTLIKELDNFNNMEGCCRVDGWSRRLILNSNPRIGRNFVT